MKNNNIDKFVKELSDKAKVRAAELKRDEELKERENRDRLEADKAKALETVKKMFPEAITDYISFVEPVDDIEWS